MLAALCSPSKHTRALYDQHGVGLCGNARFAQLFNVQCCSVLASCRCRSDRYVGLHLQLAAEASAAKVQPEKQRPGSALSSGNFSQLDRISTVAVVFAMAMLGWPSVSQSGSLACLHSSASLQRQSIRRCSETTYGRHSVAPSAQAQCSHRRPNAATAFSGPMQRQVSACQHA